MNGYRVCRTSARNGAHRAAWHWVGDASGVTGPALCRARPKLATGHTWRTGSNQPVTCPKCLRLAALIAAADKPATGAYR